MFTITRFRRPLGIGPNEQVERADTVRDNVPERSEAIRFVKQHIGLFTANGYNEEQDYWWCRNEGDEVTEILAIRASPDLSVRSN